MIADAGDGLLCVGDDVEENLREQAGIGFDRGQRTGIVELDGDGLLAQRRVLLLENTLNDFINANPGAAHDSGTRKSEQVLNDGGGAASLLQNDFNLAARGVVRRAFAKEIADA